MGDELWIESIEGDGRPSFERRWETPPPAEGEVFRITDETWLWEDARQVQVIHQWEGIEPPGDPKERKAV